MMIDRGPDDFHVNRPPDASPPTSETVAPTMPMEDTTSESHRCSSAVRWRRPWLAWLAFAWILAFPACFPFVHRFRPSAEVLCVYNILMTVISMMAVLALVFVPRKWWKVVTIPLAGIVVLLQTGEWMAPQIRFLSDAIESADRIIVRDGGFDCCGPVDDEAILFEVVNPSEVAEVRAHMDFSYYGGGRCACCGFPGIDWYQGKERLALTAVQHGKAIRWKGGDECLTEDSREWIVEWLVAHGVNVKEIEGGCGGPRKGLRRQAARMKLAAICVARGESHATQGDTDAAIADFTEAVEHDVTCGPAYFGRGLAQEKKGHLAQAIKDFDEAIRISQPDHLKYRIEAAKFIPDFAQVPGLDGNLAPMYDARDRVYQKQGYKAEVELLPR